MSEFIVAITAFTERKADRFSQVPAKTFGGIVVKPPIQVGERFKDAVLGRYRYQVDVCHVVTTDQATVFVAESGRAEAEARQADVYTIADRIGQLANAPETVIQMIDSSPFPDPDGY